MGKVAFTLTQPKNFDKICAVVDGLSVGEAMFVARELMGAAMSSFDRAARPALLRAFVAGVTADVEQHEREEAQES